MAREPDARGRRTETRPDRPRAGTRGTAKSREHRRRGRRSSATLNSVAGQRGPRSRCSRGPPPSGSSRRSAAARRRRRAWRTPPRTGSCAGARTHRPPAPRPCRPASAAHPQLAPRRVQRGEQPEEDEDSRQRARSTGPRVPAHLRGRCTGGAPGTTTVRPRPPSVRRSRPGAETSTRQSNDRIPTVVSRTPLPCERGRRARSPSSACHTVMNGAYSTIIGIACPGSSEREQPAGCPATARSGARPAGASEGSFTKPCQGICELADALGGGVLHAHDRPVGDRPPSSLDADHAAPTRSRTGRAAAPSISRGGSPGCRPARTRSPSRVEELGRGTKSHRQPARAVRVLEVARRGPAPPSGRRRRTGRSRRVAVVVRGVGPGLALDDHRAGRCSRSPCRSRRRRAAGGTPSGTSGSRPRAASPFSAASDRGPVRTASRGTAGDAAPAARRGSPRPPGRRGRRPRRSGATRRARAPGPALAERSRRMRPRAREQAGDERDEQQRRDQREPPRAEDVEQPDAAVERSPGADGRGTYGDPPVGEVRDLRDERPSRPRRARGAGAGPARCASSAASATRGRTDWREGHAGRRGGTSGARRC